MLPPLVTTINLKFVTIFFFLFIVNCTKSFASDDTLLPYCNQTYSCGHLVNINYPFSGGPRPVYCGLPGFQLTCVDNSSLITINSLKYQVLELNQTSQTLILSRFDLNNTVCTKLLVNTTFTTTPFSNGSNNEILSLFYGCNDSVISNNKPPNQFTCEEYGKKDAYYWIGPVPTDPITDVFSCSVTLTVPVLHSLVPILENNRSLLGQVLRGGFNVSYFNPFMDDCLDCYHSQGHCGFDLDSRRPICICANDRPCPGSKSRLVSLGIGLGMAVAGVIGIGLGCWILLCVQKRKRLAEQTKCKGLLTSSSKGPPAPALNFSQTAPSSPPSNSDLEKGSTYFGTQIFSYKELVEATDNFNPSNELGDGGFGTVYHGVLNDGRIVAVKRLFENNIRRAEQFTNEIEILARLRHKNLVTLYGCTSRRSRELVLVYEYIPNGTVADHLHGNRSNSGLLTWKVRLSIAIETADAIAYLHASDVIHRDVKTNNILLEKDFRVKVADFGLSRLFPDNVTHVSTAPQGTPGYVDPEYHQCYQLTDKSDVYSFGVVLIELISSLQAVDTSRDRLDINLANMAVNKIQNHAINELVDPMLGFEKDIAARKMATSVAELAFRCLQQERDMRPTMAEVSEALRKIESEVHQSEKVGILDIMEDDFGVFSPDESATNEKWGKPNKTM